MMFPTVNRLIVALVTYGISFNTNRITLYDKPVLLNAAFPCSILLMWGRDGDGPPHTCFLAGRRAW